MAKRLSLFLVTGCTAFGAFATDITFVGQDYPPYQWQENGTMVGLFPEVAAQVCKKIKAECSFRVVPLKRAAMEVENGETDAILSYIKSPEREKSFVFTHPVAVTGKAYFGNKAKVGKLSKIEDLKDATVGTVRDSTSSKLAQQHKQVVPSLKLEEESNNETVLNKLAGSRYGDKGLALGNQDVLSYLIKKNALSNIEKVLFVETEEYSIAFSKKKGGEARVKEFDSALQQLQASGALAAIYTKYGVELRPAK